MGDRPCNHSLTSRANIVSGWANSCVTGHYFVHLHWSLFKLNKFDQQNTNVRLENQSGVFLFYISPSMGYILLRIKFTNLTPRQTFNMYVNTEGIERPVELIQL